MRGLDPRIQYFVEETDKALDRRIKSGDDEWAMDRACVDSRTDRPPSPRPSPRFAQGCPGKKQRAK